MKSRSGGTGVRESKYMGGSLSPGKSVGGPVDGGRKAKAGMTHSHTAQRPGKSIGTRGKKKGY